MRRNMHLYREFLRVAVLGKLQYKSDFLVGIISVFILNAVNISLIWVLVYRFHDLNGWGIWDLLFLYSFWMISRGVYGVFFWHLGDMEEMIVSGSFDAYLIRPASPFLQLMGKDINYSGVGDLLVGIVGFILLKGQIDLHFDFGNWLFFLFCILSGAMIQVAINWIGASLCFWTTRSRAVLNITERFTVLMQQYPVSIFGRYFQVFVTCFLPVAFINYYPSMILLGKAPQENAFWLYLSPLVALILLGISACIWICGIKRYSGAGN